MSSDIQEKLEDFKGKIKEKNNRVLQIYIVN